MLESKYAFTAVAVCFILFSIHLSAAVLLEERRFSIRKTSLLWMSAGVIFFLIVYFCYSLLPRTIRLPSAVLISFIYFWATFIYASADGLWKKCYLWVTYGTVFCIIWPFSVMLSNVFVPSGYDIAAYLVRAVLQFIFCISLLLAYRRFIRPLIRDVSGFQSKSWIRLFVSSIIFFLLFLVMLSLMAGENWTDRKLFFFFLLDIAAFAASNIVSLSIIYYMHKEGRDEALKQNLVYMDNFVGNVREREDEIRRFRHDMRHHNEYLSSLAREGKCSEILEYLGSRPESGDNQKSWCPHIVVNGILSSYSRKAMEAGVEFSASADTPAHSDIKDVDYVSILANLLENAIHAMEKTKNPGPLSVDIRRVGEKTVILVSNPSEDIKLENGLPVNRSIGIDSIITTARKYQGEVNYSFSGGICSCCVILNA